MNPYATKIESQMPALLVFLIMLTISIPVILSCLYILNLFINDVKFSASSMITFFTNVFLDYLIPILIVSTLYAAKEAYNTSNSNTHTKLLYELEDKKIALLKGPMSLKKVEDYRNALSKFREGETVTVYDEARITNDLLTALLIHKSKEKISDKASPIKQDNA
jgi:hypothetical protein